MNNFYEELIIIFLKNEIKNIILTISKEYPKIININDAKKLIIKYNCKLNNIIFTNYSENENMNLKLKAIKNNFKKNNSKKISKTFEDKEKKCNARIWNGGLIYKKENNEIIYGGQCTFKKIHGTKYCKRHQLNRPHGNYFKKISKELIKHYEKYNKN